MSCLYRVAVSVWPCSFLVSTQLSNFIGLHSIISHFKSSFVMSLLTSLQSAQTSELLDIFLWEKYRTTVSKSYTVQTNTRELGILNCCTSKVQL